MTDIAKWKYKNFIIAKQNTIKELERVLVEFSNDLNRSTKHILLKKINFLRNEIISISQQFREIY